MGSALAILKAVQAQFELDRGTDYTSLHTRDRSIAKELKVEQSAPLQQVVAWATHLQANAIQQFSSAERGVKVLLATLGFFFGVGLAAVTLFYDGTHPVNVVRAMLVLVVLPFLFLCGTLLVILPEGILLRLPGFQYLIDLALVFSPRRILAMISPVLPERVREEIRSLQDQFTLSQTLFRRIHTWVFVHSGHLFALFFSLGVLAYCMLAITFTDIAFAWSTTLQVETDKMHTLTTLWAAPWSVLFPDAVPSIELVEQSRYYRFNESSSFLKETGGTVAQLGGWWPFLVLSVITYVLLPRFVLCWVAAFARDRSIHRLLNVFPGTDLLVHRMCTPVIETQAQFENSSEERDASIQDNSSLDVQALQLQGPTACVVWALKNLKEDELHEALTKAFPKISLDIRRAGGALEFSQDQKVIQFLRESASEKTIVMLVPGWEPPVSEIFDFIAEIRSVCRPEEQIVVVPLLSDGTTTLGGVAENHLSIWARKVAQLSDPWVRVQRWEIP